MKIYTCNCEVRLYVFAFHFLRVVEHISAGLVKLQLSSDPTDEEGYRAWVETNFSHEAESVLENREMELFW